MDDLLKNVAIGLFSFLVVHGSLETRVRRNAERQAQASFQFTGSVRARIEPRGMFGLFTNDLWAVDIYGQGMRSDELPFRVTPRGGWKGSIRHLRLHFREFTLRGLPVDRLEADIPFATYDLGHAINKGRLFLRSAGIGPAQVAVGTEGLRVFVSRKYASTLSDVKVAFPNQKLTLTGRYRFAGSLVPISATGNMVPRDGRYIDIIDPEFRLNGLLLAPKTAQNLLKQINPVLDTEADLGLKGYFTLQSVRVGDNGVLIDGRMTIPPAVRFGPSARPGSQ